MKKYMKICIVIVIMLLILITTVFIISKNLTTKIGDDYFARIYYAPSSEFGENAYIYLDENNNVSKIIRTKWNTETYASPSIKQEIVEVKKIGKYEDFKDIIEEIYNSYSGYTVIILNQDISKNNTENYSKGDSITLDELVSLLISIKSK